MKKSFFKFIKNLIYRFKDDDVPALAAQLAYSLLVSFFPFLIFLMTLIGYSELRSENVLIEMQRLLPYDAFKLIDNIIIEIVDTRNGNLLSFGIIITIWTASSGFRAVIKGINKAYDEREKRSIIKVISISIISTFGFILLIIIVMLFLVFGQIIGNKVAIKFGFVDFFIKIWNIFRYIIIISYMIFIFAMLYHYIPSKRLTWKEVIPGAVFATIGWLITSLGFAFYINNFGNYSKVYGSVGAVFVLLTWLYLSAIIIIMGGEVNAIFAFDKKDNL